MFQGASSESILGSVLNDRININKKFAAPVYKISNEYIHASSRGQKTDIVLKINDLYYIIDAKYYSASNANNAPSLPDIIKQFYYVKSMSLIVKEAIDIFSIFVFPGVKGNIESIHMALKDTSTKLDQIDLLDEHYPPIFCLYKDPIRLIHLYANGKKMNLDFLKEIT
ncbi:LlaJI family restriction endonuclease [Escherichia coli]